MNVLAADVNLSVIVRRDCERQGPNEAILQLFCWPTVSLVGPDFDIARLPVAHVVALDDAADTARTGGTGPDDVAVYGIRRGPAAFAAAHRMPRASRNSSSEPAAAKAASAGVARPAIRRPVLLVTVDVVWNLVIYRHVIHLSDGELDSIPGAPARDRDRNAAVVCHSHPVWVSRIDPHVVVVAPRAAGERGDLCCLAAIKRHREGSCQVVAFVFVVRRHGHAKVIMRATTEIAVVTHQSPVLAAIVRAPELASIRFLAFEWNAVAGLNQRVYAVGVGARDGDSDLAGRTGRESAASAAFPRCTTIRGFEKPTARSTAFPAPGVYLKRPHSSEQNAWVVRIHHDV